MKKDKKMLIILGIVIIAIVGIVIGIIIFSQSKWKDFETYKMDRFSIKYPNSWKMKKEATDTGNVTNFTDDNVNSVRVISQKKEDMPENQNTLEKFINNIKEQMDSSNLKEYQSSSPIVKDIESNGVAGKKVTFLYKTLLGESQVIYVVFEKNEIFYSLVMQGKEIEIFEKMLESFKIK